MFITIDRKVVRVEDDSEEKLRKIRASKIMRAQDRRQKEIDAEKRRRGYCIDCHILLTQSGKCSNCGTVWKFHNARS